jgi:hypothetical protein
MFDMQSRTGRRKGMICLGRRKDKRLGVEKTLERDDRKQVAAGGSATIVEADITLAAIKAGITQITTTLKLFTSGIRGKDGGRKTGHPETLDKDIIAAFGGDTEKTLTQRVVRGLVGNA